MRIKYPIVNKVAPSTAATFSQFPTSMAASMMYHFPKKPPVGGMPIILIAITINVA